MEGYVVGVAGSECFGSASQVRRWLQYRCANCQCQAQSPPRLLCGSLTGLEKFKNDKQQAEAGSVTCFVFVFTVSCVVPASVTCIYHAAVSVPGQRIDETLGHLADSDKRTGSQNHSGSCTIKSFPSLRRVSELLKLQVQVSGAHSCHGGQADTKVPLLRSLGSGRA